MELSETIGLMINLDITEASSVTVRLLGLLNGLGLVQFEWGRSK